ncbi:leucine-rich repeat (LRR) protein 1 [Hibiscus trionum]|uniref:Leucine-rich repeat (LRR) protein 1 n=1 Tax=Hibiscus trionum TaxID=183268 RepID=A0A9W7GWG7_HIBTR|nr:leucine-rich repeat (LRR) protein 1 [Hibiscus trionum]
MTFKMHDLMHDLSETVAGRESSILDLKSSASEVDENCRHVSADFSLIPLFKGKKLRTLLKISGGCSKKKFWDFIISDCRSLRVLEFNNVNCNIVPHSIHKLQHLRYFDLSRNRSLKILPKSTSKIQNLQVLKLDGCWDLVELPKKIEKLVNLTHLPCENCDSLTHMPRGIGKLTSLQTLSQFVVDKRGSHGAAAAGLSELSGLNNLRGKLTIKNLGWVKDAKHEFRAANLKEKQHLQSLVLEWSDGAGDDEEKSLEELQPHSNLKELKVKGWRGNAKFPSWFSLLTNLAAIEIQGPSKFKHLPSFAQLTHLQRLCIEKLTELEYMENSEPSGGRRGSEPFFPSLTSLRLMQCPNLKSWWRKRQIDDHNNNDNGTDTNINHGISLSF